MLRKPKTCLGEVNAEYQVAALKAVFLQLVTDLQDPIVSYARIVEEDEIMPPEAGRMRAQADPKRPTASSITWSNVVYESGILAKPVDGMG